ncbi:NAD(P)/FAD-dependent oxidoreductase [Candidatus Bathyarchaeota archaeon]|nr:NAD(P)/FAD-dependent oxidoreductase [Candidatus Bathyarchaeota archaeon]MBS7617854.1 NAD(P)/FAD-dependent oxidoreductase [Candidatus Bathyarchaeota archaeon]
MALYDVVIVGCGPAGIFTALELSEKSDLSILMFEKGLDIRDRKCPALTSGFCSKQCKPCNLLNGWGGAGAFSDGKLILSPDVGGWLTDYVPREELENLVKYVDTFYRKFGVPDKIYGGDGDFIEDIRRRAVLAGLNFIPMTLRHMGTDKANSVLEAARRYLNKRVEVKFRTEVAKVLVENGKSVGVETSDGEVYRAKYVVLAPGRSGAEWLQREARRFQLGLENNPIDLGVRVEVPAAVMEPLTNALYEPKFQFYSKSFDDMVRVFCVCPQGEVITEIYDDVLTVNGQSYSEKKTDNTNFAVLVSVSFTEPFKEPIAYGKYIARLANIIGGGVIIQRLGDLKNGRRSTEDRINRSIVKPTLKNATPGDLSFVLPYRYLTDILEMLEALDKLTPGVFSNHTLLYGVEVKFYSARIKLDRNLETDIKNLYVAGDGAGITRGLMQASVSGVIVARSILAREGIKTDT